MSGTQEQNDQKTGADDLKKQEQNAAGAQNPPKEGKEEGGIKTLDEALKEIESLRKENAKHRTGNKSLEEKLKGYDDQFSKIKKAFGIEEEVDPEEQIKNLNSKSESLEVEVALQSAARAHGIPLEHDNYFRFLLNQKFEALNDNEELSDDEIAEVAAEVMKYAGVQGKKSTGVDSGKSGGKSDDAGDEFTVEQFKKMSFVQRNNLYTSNRALYDKLSAASK